MNEKWVADEIMALKSGGAIQPHHAKHSKGGTDEVSLDASQITSGTLDTARIPGLDASKIISGTLDTNRIPNLPVSKISDFPDYIPFGVNVTKSGQDEKKVYTVITWEMPTAISGYPAKWTSVLSGGTTPNYTTRTVTVYASDKTTVLRTYVYTRSFDTDGKLISEVLQ